MNVITHDADSVARQVVPQDFSFLSDADRHITQALETMLRTMLNIQGANPILLKPLSVSSKVVPGEGTKYKLAANTVLYNGAIYDMPAADELAATSIDRYLEGLYVVPVEEFVDPSPVYGDGLERNVYCHKRLVMRYLRNPEEEFKVSDLDVLPKVMKAGLTISGD